VKRSGADDKADSAAPIFTHPGVRSIMGSTGKDGTAIGHVEKKEASMRPIRPRQVAVLLGLLSLVVVLSGCPNDQEPGNPLFNGTFRGTVTTTQHGQQSDDILTATLALHSPLDGTFVTESGQEGTLSGEAFGDDATFTSTADGDCPASSAGHLALLDENTIQYDASGTDCDGPFTQTGTLIRVTNRAPEPTAPPIAIATNMAGTSQIAPNDPDAGQTHTFAITTPPAHGMAGVDPTGVVTYTPDQDFQGQDSLEVTVTDDGTPPLSGTVVIDITVTKGNAPPVANAGTPQTVQAGATVHLDGSGSSDSDGDPLTYHWSLTATPPSSTATLSDAHAVAPSFVADKVGTYTAQLVVNDGTVDSAPATVDITATTDTTPPNVQFVNPTDGATVNTTTPTFTITFDDSGSGVDLTSYQTFVNGVDVTASTTVTATGATYTQAAPLPAGDNQATATIADLAGNVRSVTIRFTVEVFRAIADCAPTSGNVPLQVRLRSRGEFTGGSIVRYRWDYQGDGTFDTNDPVARDFTFTFAQQGTFMPLLEVTNNFGETATDTCTIEAQGNKPTATANASPSNGPIPLAVDLTCTGSDPDGSIALYEWDFDGDGTFDFSSPTSGNTNHTYTGEGTLVAVCRVTDNDGLTGEARTTTTIIRPAPPGSPSVEATASPASGDGPLQVSFDGSVTGGGTIVLWEWDFDGDGTFDFSSDTSPATMFTYDNAGIFAAALRATDDTGLTGTDTVEVVVNINASLSIPDDTFEPRAGETATINTTLSAGVPVRILLKNQSGTVIRTLVDAFRAAGSYMDEWDGRDDADQPLPQGPYFAVLEYDFGGEVRSIDLTNTTGGVRYNPSRNTLPRTFSPFEDDLLTVNFTVPSSRGASEIQAFIGLFNTDTRLITLLDRLPLGVGPHTIYWDGIDANGNFAVPPPGDQFLFGIFGFTLPDNAIFLQAAPVLSNVMVDPNFFDPSTPDFVTPAAPMATITYDLDVQADVELTVTNLHNGLVLRRIRQFNVAAGTSLMISWDGRASDGRYVDVGDYRLTLQATDATGSSSLTRFALVRVFY
jgi:PKD repeat protein